MVVYYDNSKETPLFGQLPIFEEDGKLLAQSHTICRYLARKHGLAGKNDWEAAQADMYVDCIYDQMGGIIVDITIVYNWLDKLECIYKFEI